MTPSEEGFLMFHNLLDWLARLDLKGDAAVSELKKRIYTEPLPAKVKMALLQIIHEIEDHGL